MNNTTSHQKQYCIVEHIWRLGRWILGLVVLICWDAPTSVYFAFIALGVYEQLHGYICRFIERVLHFKQQHGEWE